MFPTDNPFLKELLNPNTEFPIENQEETNIFTTEPGVYSLDENGNLLENSVFAIERNVLIEELGIQGIKHNPTDIVEISKTATGKIIFLENGTSRAGLRHIVEKHGQDFANRGITEEQIPNAVISAVTNGKVVGTQGKNRTIYEVEINGQNQRIAVTVGDNGYIVGANPARNK